MPTSISQYYLDPPPPPTNFTIFTILAILNAFLKNTSRNRSQGYKTKSLYIFQ